MFLVNMSTEILEMAMNKSSALGSLRGTTMALLTSGEINKITFQLLYEGLIRSHKLEGTTIPTMDMDRLRPRAAEHGITI